MKCGACVAAVVTNVNCMYFDSFTSRWDACESTNSCPTDPLALRLMIPPRHTREQARSAHRLHRHDRMGSVCTSGGHCTAAWCATCLRLWCRHMRELDLNCWERQQQQREHAALCSLHIGAMRRGTRYKREQRHHDQRSTPTFTDSTRTPLDGPCRRGRRRQRPELLISCS